ncbi:MAG: hypothetical protein ACO1OK_04290, partial [Devosia sp.]
MATLNINGRRVKVDDSFRNLSPEQQQATVDEIARSAGLVAGAPGSDAVKLTGRAGPRPAELGMSPNIQDRRPGEGLAMNALGGLNRSLLEMSGGVVDRARNTINWGVAGVNALRGADDLTQGMIRNAVGDSDSITGALGAVGFRDPRTIKPKSGPERIAAGLGEGVGYTLGPQAAVSTLGRLGAMAPKTREALSPLVGGLGVRETVQNAVAGAGAGAGAAAGMEVAPDSLDPLAGLAGGLGGALAGTAVAAIPGAVRSAGRVAGDFLAPLTSNGRQRLAGQTLYDAASNPEAAMGSLANPRQIVPGSLPTTFQATGDMGLGALERGAATRAPDAFNQRRADQNAARLGQMSGLGGNGAPEAVVSSLRARL